MKETDKYHFFWKGPFSQWFKSPFVDPEHGHNFNTAEQYQMFSKAKHFEDHEMCEKILAEKNPRKQKDLGRQVKNFNQQTWDAVCKHYVYLGNKYKFEANSELKAQLLATGSKILIEASPFDSIWAIGMTEDDPGVEDPSNWKGMNYLGQVLTALKFDFIKEELDKLHYELKKGWMDQKYICLVCQKKTAFLTDDKLMCLACQETNIPKIELNPIHNFLSNKSNNEV